LEGQNLVEPALMRDRIKSRNGRAGLGFHTQSAAHHPSPIQNLFWEALGKA
jgi:hypothetical protein